MGDIEKREVRKFMEEAINEIPDSSNVFATKVLGGFPTSEAAVETGFSKHKAIHSKFRAKLENEFVEKVPFIRENLLYLKEKKVKRKTMKTFYNPSTMRKIKFENKQL